LREPVDGRTGFLLDVRLEADIGRCLIGANGLTSRILILANGEIRCFHPLSERSIKLPGRPSTSSPQMGISPSALAFALCRRVPRRNTF
jgi:hypothetical protein